jgi:hypothetical protein
MSCFYHRGNIKASGFAANSAQRLSNGESMQQKWQVLEVGLGPRAQESGPGHSDSALDPDLDIKARGSKISSQVD